MRNHARENQRMSERSRMCSALTWTLASDDLPRIGWLLDQSKTGCAFAWRGDDLPIIGDVIHINRGEADSAGNPERALVMRVTVAHGDLVIIAVRVIEQFPILSARRARRVHAERHTMPEAGEVKPLPVPITEHAE